jgi:hypothetical protein
VKRFPPRFTAGPNSPEDAVSGTASWGIRQSRRFSAPGGFALSELSKHKRNAAGPLVRFTSWRLSRTDLPVWTRLASSSVQMIVSDDNLAMGHYCTTPLFW